MNEIEFLNALGRLLRDGQLRDAFARDRHQVAIKLSNAPDVRAALQQLSSDELEVQAVVLLRKRFRKIEAILPQTCSNLGASAWPYYLSFARTQWFSDAASEALRFCQWLSRKERNTAATFEFHRLRFESSRARFALHLVRTPSTLLPRVQLFCRLWNRPREWRMRIGV